MWYKVRTPTPSEPELGPVGPRRVGIGPRMGGAGTSYPDDVQREEVGYGVTPQTRWGESGQAESGWG